MKLKIERLRDFERDPSNNFLTRSEMMEAVKELIALREAQKGEQAQVANGTTEKCSPDVYAKGVSACLVDIPKEKAEVICRGISAASGVAVDWHYFGGRVHIKAMRVTALQKLTDLPYDVLFNAIAKSATPLGEHMSISVKDFKAAIEAAGGLSIPQATISAAPQKPVISKEKLCDWLEDNFDIDDSQRDAFAQCFAHHCNCIVKDGD